MCAHQLRAQAEEEGEEGGMRQQQMEEEEEEARALQAEEVEVLAAMFGEEQVRLRGKGGVVDIELQPQVECSFWMPVGYPLRQGVSKVSVETPLLPRVAREAIATEVLRLSAEEAGCEHLMLLCQSIREQIDEATTVSTAQNPDASNVEGSHDAVARPTPRQFGRRMLYFHHISSPQKRAFMLECAEELGISGYFVIGRPGFMLCEGPEENVKTFVSSVQGMRWKQVCVRGEEIIDLPTPADDVDPCDPLDIMRKFPPLSEMPEGSLSEFARRCADAGLQALFRTGLRIYRDDKDSDGDHDNDNHHHSFPKK